MPKFQSKFVKVSSSTGKTGTVKKDGYAAGGPPECVQASKPGLTDFAPYSGPSVAKPSRD